MTGKRASYYEDFSSPEQLGKALRQAWVYDRMWSRHLNKTHGRKPTGLPPHAFVVTAQNHDQVGNRTAGERLAALVDEGRLKAAAAPDDAVPPQLFQGEEWAASAPFMYFTDHADAGLGKAVAEGCRREFAAFGWNSVVPDPQDPGTFERSILGWDEVDEPYHRGMLKWYRGLIALRRRLPAVAQRVLAQVEGDRIVFERNGVLVRVHRGVPDGAVVEIAESV